MELFTKLEHAPYSPASFKDPKCAKSGCPTQIFAVVSGAGPVEYITYY